MKYNTKHNIKCSEQPNTLPVTKIQHFCTKDGPGIRTTVFLKGCPLSCIWCHNPETKNTAPEFFYTDKLCIYCGACAAVCPCGAHKIYKTESNVSTVMTPHSTESTAVPDAADNGIYRHEIDRAACKACKSCSPCSTRSDTAAPAQVKCTDVCPTGALEICCKYMTVNEIISQVTADAAFYGKKGGVTFSGGEPTLHARILSELLNEFHRQKINTAIETCGYFDTSLLSKLIPSTDLFLWDIKDTDEKRHIANTGVSCSKIINNLKNADEYGAKTLLRCIMIKTINFNKEHIDNILSVYNSLKNCTGIELIPYHTYGSSKYTQLGDTQKISAGAGRSDWVPGAADIAKAEEYMSKYANIVHN